MARAFPDSPTLKSGVRICSLELDVHLGEKTWAPDGPVTAHKYLHNSSQTQGPRSHKNLLDWESMHVCVVAFWHCTWSFSPQYRVNNKVCTCSCTIQQTQYVWYKQSEPGGKCVVTAFSTSPNNQKVNSGFLEEEEKLISMLYNGQKLLVVWRQWMKPLRTKSVCKVLSAKTLGKTSRSSELFCYSSHSFRMF